MNISYCKDYLHYLTQFRYIKSRGTCNILAKTFEKAKKSQNTKKFFPSKFKPIIERLTVLPKGDATDGTHDQERMHL